MRSSIPLMIHPNGDVEALYMRSSMTNPCGVMQVDIKVHVCNAYACERLLRKTAKPRGVTVTGNLATCSGCVQAKGRRASVPRVTFSRVASPLQRVFVITLPAPRTSLLPGELYTSSCSRMARRA